ncbi:PhosphoLipase [Phytophthora megakarya]|uniref:PhosphoLipase n=1 Tax=Phytophthora megakarya TaxID=4795 RepID=A0A225WTX1_9STRA|nr:PhosphoLipase [Phytophthora megakarya]
MQQHKQQINELIKRMERLLEEEDNFETDSDGEIEWNGVQLAAIPSQTVWHNLCALQDCNELLDGTVTLFKQKIRESVELAAADPQTFALERTESSSSIPVSESSEDQDEVEDFQDVVPVKGRKAAVALNNDVTERVQNALQDEEEFEAFKANALQFGMGNESAERFYGYLSQHIPAPVLDYIVVDFARLLPQPALRVPLLKQHYEHMKNELARPSIVKFKNKSYSTSISSLRRLSTSSSIDEAGSSGEEGEEYPSTIRLRTFNHLVFVIHGIGQHIDFRDGEFKSWNGETGVEGGNHAFRDIFRSMLETTFQDIPLALEMQSIEWHEDLHEPTGLDNIFDLISPEGSSAIRQFNKETFMDVLYYLSPRYGQLIVDSVTQQLNEKYRVFMDEHPGWDGKISIFAHSLGSMIAYDILTHKPGEVAINGVRFAGLDFEIDTFFGVGSPVGVMILARGDLNIDDGEFTPGIKIPSCRRYFNVYHPIDPIAYRIEPLIKQEMHDKDPVQLMQFSAVKDQAFGQLQEAWEGLTGPVHGFQYRHDYVMRRRKREQGMMEVAFAAASHSSYWMSDDVVLFTIMQLCQPVVDTLHRYMSARVPLPKLMRSIVELTPHTKVLLSATALVRDRCTGLSREQIVLIDKDRLYFLSRLSEVACRRKWRVKLTPTTKATYGEDSFMMKIVPSDAAATEPDVPPTSNNANQPDAHIFKAPSTPVRNAWMNVINETIAKTGSPISEGLIAAKMPRDTANLVDLSTGKSIDYFNAIKAGFLKEKTANGWYDSWNDRWLVLQDDHLSCYENSPKLDFVGQFPLHKTKAFCYEREYLIRVVARRGAACEMRVQNQDSFNRWVEIFERIPTVEIFRHKDLLENSPSSVLIMTESSRGSFGTTHKPKAGNEGEWLQTKIEGHQIKLDENDQEYVAFVIQVASSTVGTSIVQRRYSEFAKLHRQLRKMFQHEQIPALPGTRMWNKFEPNYLKQKAIALHGYLNGVCQRCANTRAQPLLLEFLELASQNPQESKGTTKEEDAEKNYAEPDK